MICDQRQDRRLGIHRARHQALQILPRCADLLRQREERLGTGVRVDSIADQLPDGTEYWPGEIATSYEVDRIRFVRPVGPGASWGGCCVLMYGPLPGHVLYVPVDEFELYAGVTVCTARMGDN